MRVAIVLKTFPPAVIGGMERQTEQMAAELTAAGHDVTVFTKQTGPTDDSHRPYEVQRVRNWRFTPFVSDLTFLLCALIALVRRRREFDLLQCMMLYPVGFLGWVCHRITGLPYFAWVRGGDYYLMNDIWWKRWMMRRVLSDTLVLAQSKEIRDDIERDFDDLEPELDVLGNAVSIPDDTADGEGILYVGRLAPKKGVEYLVRAVADIDSALTVVGDGPERERLERLAAETGATVEFEGFVDPEEVGEYYRSAAVFVLPSVEGEGMPNVVLEAMAWRLPVIATDSGGIETVVNDGETGVIVPMRDTNRLAEAIQDLQSDETRRKRLGTRAREHVQANHSWESLVERLEVVYDRVYRDGG